MSVWAQLFDFFDEDRSGFVDKKEMLEKLGALGFDSHGVNQLFYDITGESRAVVSEKEFMRYLQKASSEANAPVA